MTKNNQLYSLQAKLSPILYSKKLIHVKLNILYRKTISILMLARMRVYFELPDNFGKLGKSDIELGYKMRSDMGCKHRLAAAVFV